MPEENGKNAFVYSVFDGMVYDITNNLDKSMSSYEDHAQFCQTKNGNLVSVDSKSKLSILIKLIDEHNANNGLKKANYLIGM